MRILKDSQGRTFPYLRLSLTDLCNFRCNYCLPDGCCDSHHKTVLSVAEIKRLVTAFSEVGVEKIRLTGGEPTLRSDFLEIVQVIGSVPSIKTIAMTTNGYRMENHVGDWLDAGIDQINLSIDSLDPVVFETITGHRRFSSIMKGVHRAFEHGLASIKVNSVLMKGVNDHELEKFLEWIRHQPITVRFIELMETGDNNSFFHKHHLPGEVFRDKLLRQGWIQHSRERTAGPACEFSHPDYRGRIGLITPYAKDFCKGCNRLRVTSQGQLQLCLFADQGHNLRHLLKCDSQKRELISEIRSVLKQKVDSHFLLQGYTGATRTLSQVGG